MAEFVLVKNLKLALKRLKIDCFVPGFRCKNDV